MLYFRKGMRNIVSRALCRNAAKYAERRSVDTKKGAEGRPFRKLRVESVALDTERNAHTAADAKSGEALFDITTLHFKQQRVENAAA